MSFKEQSFMSGDKAQTFQICRQGKCVVFDKQILFIFSYTMTLNKRK